jgi:hypothetical protein
MFTSHIADFFILYPSYQLCPGKTILNLKRSVRLFSPPRLLPSLPRPKKLIVPSPYLLLSPLSDSRAHAPAAYLPRSASFVAGPRWYGSLWQPLCLPPKPHGAMYLSAACSMPVLLSTMDRPHISPRPPLPVLACNWHINVSFPTSCLGQQRTTAEGRRFSERG